MKCCQWGRKRKAHCRCRFKRPYHKSAIAVLLFVCVEFSFLILLVKMYSMMTVIQLKDELRKRKASVVGKKACLIERLEAYDRNANFGVDDDSKDEAYIAPAAEHFRDINASSRLPQLTKNHIQAFVERFQAQMKGRQMYESRFLVTARVAVDGDITYIQGQCKAQMKKLVYVVNITLNKDGSIEQTHCECAAGSGVEAHCKHVMVLLHGVEDIVRTKTIILHQVCTQKLMDFKRPRKVFYDSPMQAQKLPNKRKRSVNYAPLKLDDIMDNYEDYVRNLAISYGNSSMPILQTIKPANAYAVEWDHHYSKVSPKDIILEKLFLKNVTKEKINDIELKTRLQYRCNEWHKLRSHRLTASNFHTIAHSKPQTQEHLAEKLLNPKSFVSKATTHGKVQEPIALQKYCTMYSLSVQECGLFISQTHPYLGASPDGLLGEDTVIEVKCPYVPRYCKINNVTVPFLEKRDGELYLKENHPYYYQIQGQLFCTNRKYCNLIIYTFVDIKIIYVYRNEPFLREMIHKLDEFYKNYFLKAILEKEFYKNYNKLS